MLELRSGFLQSTTTVLNALSARIVLVELEALETGSFEYLAVDVERVKSNENEEQHGKYDVECTAKHRNDIDGAHNLRESTVLNIHEL